MKKKLIIGIILINSKSINNYKFYKMNSGNKNISYERKNNDKSSNTEPILIVNQGPIQHMFPEIIKEIIKAENNNEIRKITILCLSNTCHNFKDIINLMFEKISNVTMGTILFNLGHMPIIGLLDWIPLDKVGNNDDIDYENYDDIDDYENCEDYDNYDDIDDDYVDCENYDDIDNCENCEDSGDMDCDFNDDVGDYIDINRYILSVVSNKTHDDIINWINNNKLFKIKEFKYIRRIIRTGNISLCECTGVLDNVNMYKMINDMVLYLNYDIRRTREITRMLDLICLIFGNSFKLEMSLYDLFELIKFDTEIYIIDFVVSQLKTFHNFDVPTKYTSPDTVIRHDFIKTENIYFINKMFEEKDIAFYLNKQVNHFYFHMETITGLYDPKINMALTNRQLRILEHFLKDTDYWESFINNLINSTTPKTNSHVTDFINRWSK